MLQIKDSLFIAVLFDGVEYPLEESGFRSITLMSGARYFLPTMRLDLVDNARFFHNRVPMADGIPVEIQIGNAGDSITQVYKFRVFRHKSQLVNGSNSYTIVGYLDSPAYLFKSTARGIRATSSGALQEIANLCGLKFEGQGTSDLQTWLPGNSRYAVFANRIARHGYRNDQSFMQLAVTNSGKMIYRNLAELDTTTEAPLFTHADPSTYKNNSPVFQVVDYKVLSNSGFLNASGGYAQSVVTQSVTSPSRISNSLDVKRLTENLMINDDIHTDIDRSRVDVRPVDGGNVHESYERAAYQNFRASLVYAMGVELMTFRQTGIDLLDMVNYTAVTQSNAEASENEAHTGAYLVSGKTLHIVVGNYYEKFQLTTTGTNKEAQGAA